MEKNGATRRTAGDYAELWDARFQFCLAELGYSAEGANKSATALVMETLFEDAEKEA